MVAREDKTANNGRWLAGMANIVLGFPSRWSRIWGRNSNDSLIWSQDDLWNVCKFMIIPGGAGGRGIGGSGTVRLVPGHMEHYVRIIRFGCLGLE
jgi:hypothetical protein